MLAIDIYINETTSKADLILPPLTHLEHANYDFLFGGTATRNFACYSPRVFEADRGHEQWWIMLSVLAAILETTWEALDDMMVDGLVNNVLRYVAADNPSLTAEQVKEAIGEERGFERLIDAMLRAGPYGDKFAGCDGLSLAALKVQGGAVDLGPLQSQLPAMLRTPSKRINLCHPHFLADIPRLDTQMRQSSISTQPLLLIGRRHIRDMNSWLHNLPNYVRGKPRCTLLMHPEERRMLPIQSVNVY